MILALLIVLPVIAVQNTRRKRLHRNRAPHIQSFESSESLIDLCPIFPRGTCSASGTIVTLEVKASDPDGDSLTYKYSVSKGAIVGVGPVVKWDLSKAFGAQTATVEVSDRQGEKSSSIAKVDVVECGSCDVFPCPFLSVTCPNNVIQGEIATFEAAIGGDTPSEPIFLWSHSNGKLLPAQKGPTLRIQALGLPGDVITGTVRVPGLDPACNYQASCESKIVRRIR